MDSGSDGPLGDGAVTTAGEDARLGTEAEATTRANAATALYEKGVALSNDRRFDEAVAAYTWRSRSERSLS